MGSIAHLTANILVLFFTGGFSPCTEDLLCPEEGYCALEVPPHI
jgi:hypothetical protein